MFFSPAWGPTAGIAARAGPYDVVVDYSNDRMETRVEDHADPPSAVVDLQAVRETVGGLPAQL